MRGVGERRVIAPLNKLMKARGTLPPKIHTHNVYVYKYVCKYICKCEYMCVCKYIVFYM